VTDESISENTRWKIVTGQKQFDQLKDDKNFWALVTLSRAVNQLRFAQMSFLLTENDTSPAAERAKLNAVLFSCAIYGESYLLVQRLNEYFGTKPLFQELAKVTTKNKKAQEIHKSNITKLRNKLIFHFDVDEIGKQLGKIDMSEPTFIDAMGTTNSQVHYVLADYCAWQTLHDVSLTASDTSPMLEQLQEDISSLIVAFTDAAEEFLMSELENCGWYKKM
jgi:hypothetical protein